MFFRKFFFPAPNPIKLPDPGQGSYTGSTFREVRDQVWSDPYDELPSYEITLGSFYPFIQNALLRASRRALTDEHDLVPHFQRLVHPLGIAFSGTWEITEDNPYTGLFAKGTKALIVARASVLLFDTTQDEPRGFAFAGKIFPTLDPDETVKTVDFFTIDVLAGTMAKYFTDVELTNEPPLGFNTYIFRLFWVVIATFANFIIADVNPVRRPVYPLAEYGLDNEEDARVPKWMMVRAWPGSGQVDRFDMRDELRVENYKDGKLIFEIYVADEEDKDGHRKWIYIGDIELDESVTSDSCDHRLKFRHPKLKWS